MPSTSNLSDCRKTSMDCRSVVAGPRASWSTMTLIFSPARLLASSNSSMVTAKMALRNFILEFSLGRFPGLRLLRASNKMRLAPAFSASLMRCSWPTLNRSRLLQALLAALSLVLPALPTRAEHQSPAPSQLAAIQGTVCDSQGRPLAGVTVHLQLQGTAQELATRS